MNDKITKMQQGRRVTYLKRCLKAQELTEQYEDGTSVRLRVFENHIKPVLNCSYQSFNNMLNVSNPKKQLDEIREQKQQKK
jgi:hypothetical protein